MEHTNCDSVSWEFFKETLNTVFLTSFSIRRCIPNGYIYEYLEGQVLIMDVLKSQDGWGVGCNFCHIGELLDSRVGMVWMIAIKYMAKYEIYNRSMNYFESQGEDVVELDKWVEAITNGMKVVKV
jgi:hypothetical protein